MTAEQSTARTAQRRRILSKLEALCDHYSHLDITEVLNNAMLRHSNVSGSWEYWASDAEMEQALDAALAEEGITISGGWKS